MASDDDRRIGHRAETVAEAFTLEQARLRPLPAEPFDPARLLSAKVDAKARVCVLQSWYSVPARLARRRVQVRLGAHQLEVLDGGQVVATHQRSLHKHTQDLVLDHYLEVLAASRARWPARPRSPRPARRACSPTPTTGSGPPRGASTATARAPRR